MTEINYAAPEGATQDTASNTSKAQGNLCATKQFFESVLPAGGLFHLRLFLGNQLKGTLYLDDVNTLASEALKLDGKGFTVYYGTGSYLSKEAKADKANVAYKQVFYIDIDVGERKDYATKKEAGAALQQAIIDLELPAPLIVVSGLGFHAYWILTEPMNEKDWTAAAVLFKTMLKDYGLKCDRNVTADSARILRPVGTHHRKTGVDIPVKVVFSNFNPISPDDWKKKVGVDPLAVDADLLDGFEVAEDFDADRDYPPSDADAVAEHCNFIKVFKETGFSGGGLEPAWHDAIGVVKHCVDGEAKCHEYSQASDNYDEDACQTKIDAWKMGPTTCQHVSDNYDYCSGCQYQGKVTSPIQLGTVLTLPGWLIRMNSEYAWIETDAGVYRLQHRDFISTEKFHAAHANDFVEIEKDGKNIKVAASKAWLTHPSRRQHTRIILQPDQPEVTADNELNEWRGFCVEDIPGDVTPWTNLYARMFGNKQRPLQWLAHKVQFPGVKQHTCLAVWSHSQGVGKNLLFESVGWVFDPYHFELISQSEVDDTYTGWMPGTGYVVGDEIHGSRKSSARDRIKTWITSTTLKSHDKNQPKRTIENMMDFVFLSNHPDAVAIGDNDRRIDPYEITAGPLPDEVAEEFVKWRDNGGLSHLRYHLQTIDLSDYNPKARAELTEDKRNMIESSRSDLERFCRDVITGAVPMKRDIVTGEEVARQFMFEFVVRGKAPQASTVSKVLIQMGGYARSNQVRKTDGRKLRCIAVANIEYWKKQPEPAWRDELEKSISAWGKPVTNTSTVDEGFDILATLDEMFEGTA